MDGLNRHDDIYLLRHTLFFKLFFSYALFVVVAGGCRFSCGLGLGLGLSLGLGIGIGIGFVFSSSWGMPPPG